MIQVVDVGEAEVVVERTEIRNGSLLPSWDDWSETERSSLSRKSTFSRCPSRSSKSSITSLALPLRTKFWRSCLSRNKLEPDNVLDSRLLLVRFTYEFVFKVVLFVSLTNVFNYFIKPSETPTDILVWELNARKKWPLLSAVRSFWLSCLSFPYDEDTGVTRSVSPTLSLARLLESAALSSWDLSQLPEVLELCQLQFPRSCWRWLVLRIATLVQLVALALWVTLVSN